MELISLPSEITALWSNLPPIEAANLSKHPKKTWEGIEGVRNAEDINSIIIHHTASEAPLDNQARYHINQHGWPGLSYHIIISGGKILQVNDLLLFTYHSSGNNDYSVSICIHGDLSKRDLMEEERKLLYAAILTVKKILPIKQVLGHNQVNATSCPCIDMDKVRTDIGTIERKQTSWEARVKKWNEFVNEVNYLSGLIKLGPNDGDALWAMNVGSEAYQVFKDKKLL